MIVTPTDNQLRALKIAVSQPWWPDILKLISDELDATREKLIATVDDTEMRRLQGKAMLAKDLRSLFDPSNEDLRKLGL